MRPPCCLPFLFINLPGIKVCACALSRARSAPRTVREPTQRVGVAEMHDIVMASPALAEEESVLEALRNAYVSRRPFTCSSMYDSHTSSVPPSAVLAQGHGQVPL